MTDVAFAPEYQGSLRGLSVNTDYAEVLRLARAHELRAEHNGEALVSAQAGLAVAESCRRLGRLSEAEAAWKDSYRKARDVRSGGVMAWALWSGGTLARQRGELALALRWLHRSCALAKQSDEILAYGYALAGVAETLRIRGDFEEARELHARILDEARARGESRHIVWSLEGLGQIERNTGDLTSAEQRFTEARETARESGDQRGEAWALRGVADVLSLAGEHERALSLLSEAETLCREMDLESALAYNRKMRGNVHYRAGAYADALSTYQDALNKFEAIRERRGEALARLGAVKSRYRLGRARAATIDDLVELRDSVSPSQLAHTRTMVENSISEIRAERDDDAE